jgi:hypothetical protein
MRRLGALAALAIVVGGVLAVILIDSDSDQPESGRLFRQRLTATDRAEARRLVSGAAELKRILGDHRYAVKSIGVWDPHVVRRHRKLLDVVTIVRVTIEPPMRTLRAQWPYIGELRPCRRHWVPLTVSDLREVFVYVDLSDSLVAAIVPGRTGGMDDWAVPGRPDSSCPSRPKAST